MTILVTLAVCLISVIGLVMLAGAEHAIGSISRDSLEKLMENHVRGAGHMYAVTRNKRQYQVMLMTGRIVASVVGVFTLFALFMQLGWVGAITDAVWISALATVVSAIVLFILTEGVIARAMAIGEYEDTVARFAFVLLVTHYLLYPLTFCIDRLLSLVIKKNIELAAKEDALLEMVKSESEAGVIGLEEKDMIQSVLDFFDTTVREVMVPRIDVVAVDKNISVEELIALFRDKGHSRIPVYDGRIDNILGVIYAKDILPVIGSGVPASMTIADTMRKAFYVPEKKKLSELLKEFKAEKVHLAVVVDEYGGTAGIVALEDLLEEIVGDIRDEYDRDERDYLWVNDRTIIIDAGLDVDDVNDIIHTEMPREDFDTLGGFIYHQLGSIPSSGESFEWEGIAFTIREVNGNRISKVLIKLPEPLMKPLNGGDRG
jgi:putative hemolysin